MVCKHKEPDMDLCPRVTESPQDKEQEPDEKEDSDMEENESEEDE